MMRSAVFSLALGSQTVAGWSSASMPAGPAAAQRSSAPIVMADRKPLIAGNWKMNTVLPEALALAKEVAEAAKGADADVAVCVPFPFIVPVAQALEGSGVGVGAQDCYYEAGGAFTAAVSTSMLKSVGTEYVLAGHSERRATFGDRYVSGRRAPSAPTDLTASPSQTASLLGNPELTLILTLTLTRSDADINKKTLKILDEGLKCILCVGELKVSVTDEC